MTETVLGLLQADRLASREMFAQGVTMSQEVEAWGLVREIPTSQKEA